MIDFTTIDFEKLNDSQTSVCEVGLVSFVNGMPELFELNSYIRPKENIERNEFAKRALTHIKDEDLLKAPTFEELYPEMKDFIGNNVLVCFNKGADLNYIYRCEKKWNLKGLYSHGYIDVKDVAEKKVISEMGETKNTKRFTARIDGEDITTIPDVVTKDAYYEIKDVKYLTNTKQIRAERVSAANSDKKFFIIIGEKTRFSKKISLEEIIRRKDLGPQ